MCLNIIAGQINTPWEILQENCDKFNLSKWFLKTSKLVYFWTLSNEIKVLEIKKVKFLRES